ncbi:hypothetical protein VPHD148_0245 [Vibrio phage D148]
MKEQHVQLEIVLDGTDKVMFASDLGWASSIGMSLDMTTLQDAKDSAKVFVESLSFVPFENDPGTEEYVNEAARIVPDIVEMIDNITIKDGKAELNVQCEFNLKMDFFETYVVDFGE